MKFRRWYSFSESIIINDVGGEPAALHVVPGSLKEFNYQDDTTYSSFFVAKYQARREGYLHVGTRPTHVGITKTTPIEQGKGTDVAFIRNLMGQLSAAKLQPIPYKEGDSGWGDVIKQLGDFEGSDKMQQQFQQAGDKDVQTPQAPNIKTGASNTQKVSPSISASRASGSWSYFIRASDASDYFISRILEMMERAIKPLLDNDIVEWYEIVDRNTGRRQKVVYSKRGETMKNDADTQYQRGVGYMKFLAENMLKNHPNAKTLVLNHINQVGIRVMGGGENPVQKIPTSNAKVPLNNLTTLVKQSYSEDNVLLFFLEAIKTDNDYLYKILDAAAKESNPRLVLHYADTLLRNDTASFYDHVGLSLYSALELFKHEDFLRKMVPNEFNEFRNQYEQAVNQFISEGDVDGRETKYLKELSKYIDIEAIDQINHLHGEVQKREEEAKRKREEEIERNKFIVQEGSAKYVVLGEGDTVWKDIPDKYIDYRGDLQEGEFCLGEIVDQEDVFYDAHERAGEEAAGNAQPRPSDTYGEDQKEVNDDIDYYGDDFINDENIDVPEDISDDDLSKLISDQYYDEFLKWRLEKLKQEEEEDSWKYEPEPDEQDIWRHQEEIAVEVAFDDKGLVVLLGEQGNNLRVEFNSKFESQLMPILKKTVEISSKENDREFGEPPLRISNKIRLSYRDKTKDRIISIYDLLKSPT